MVTGSQVLQGPPSKTRVTTAQGDPVPPLTRLEVWSVPRSGVLALLLLPQPGADNPRWDLSPRSYSLHSKGTCSQAPQATPHTHKITKIHVHFPPPLGCQIKCHNHTESPDYPEMMSHTLLEQRTDTHNCTDLPRPTHRVTPMAHQSHTKTPTTT